MRYTYTDVHIVGYEVLRIGCFTKSGFFQFMLCSAISRPVLPQLVSNDRGGLAIYDSKKMHPKLLIFGDMVVLPKIELKFM